MANCQQLSSKQKQKLKMVEYNGSIVRADIVTTTKYTKTKIAKSISSTIHECTRMQICNQLLAVEYPASVMCTQSCGTQKYCWVAINILEQGS